MRIERLMGSKSRVLVLKHLCKNPDRDFSITELAKNLGIDKSVVSNTMSFLEKEKIIDVYKRGNMKLCKLNSHNKLCVVLTEMFNNIEKSKKRGKK